MLRSKQYTQKMGAMGEAARRFKVRQQAHPGLSRAWSLPPALTCCCLFFSSGWI